MKSYKIEGSHVGALLIILAGIGWGSNGVLGLFAPNSAHPLAKGALRLLFSGIMLEAICFFIYRDTAKKLYLLKMLSQAKG